MTMFVTNNNQNLGIHPIPEIPMDILQERKRDWDAFFQRVQNCKITKDIPVSSIGNHHLYNSHETKVRLKQKKKFNRKILHQRNEKYLKTVGKTWKLLYRIVDINYVDKNSEDLELIETNTRKTNKLKTEVNKYLKTANKCVDNSQCNIKVHLEHNIKKNKIRKIKSSNIKTVMDNNRDFFIYKEGNSETKLEHIELTEYKFAEKELKNVQLEKLQYFNSDNKKRKDYEGFDDLEETLEKRKRIKLGNLLNNKITKQHKKDRNISYETKRRNTYHSDNADNNHILHSENIILLNITDFLDDKLY